jgi:hypothetical protein
MSWQILTGMPYLGMGCFGEAFGGMVYCGIACSGKACVVWCGSLQGVLALHDVALIAVERVVIRIIILSPLPPWPPSSYPSPICTVHR